MKFQKLFTCLAIATLCMLSTINARVIVRRSPQSAAEINAAFCDELSDFPAWNTWESFKSWCKDQKVGVFAEPRFGPKE